MVHKLEPFNGWKLGDEKTEEISVIHYRQPHARKFCEISMECVKQYFRK